MASRNIFLPKESNRRIPNGTYGGVRGMNNLYSIGERSEPISRMLALLMIKTFTTGLRPRENMPDSLRSLENYTTAPSARGKCTPSAYGISPRESVSRNFQSPYGSLQISLACHPGGGGFSGAIPSDTCEFRS
jgi:hypothetical protein